jgi:TolB-like protein/Tfp pilus assembly protein PilF
VKRFGPFRLDVINQCLWRGEDQISLTPKAFSVLRYLVENAGRLVTQHEMLDALWPNTFVQPGILKTHILDLRNSLEDHSQNPLFIQTVPRLGYRFIAPVHEIEHLAPPSIAVLPFVNMSRDQDGEYFSDGLAEEIINLLAQIPGLKVIARTSSFAFRGKEQDIAVIAQALGVRTVLEGSVRRAGNRIRVTAQLIRAEDRSHMWSERYDRQMADVFALQDDIATSIAAALQVKLSTQPAVAQQYIPSLKAYEALLRARHHFNKLNPESMARARECLEQSIALDPGYALPHSELGFYFTTLATFGILPAREALPLARAAVHKALAIDGSLTDCVAMLGRIAACHDYDWKEAERLFRLARARDPISPRVREHYGLVLLYSGRFTEAIEESERALQSDPLNPYYGLILGCCLLDAGRDGDAAKEFQRLLELDANYYLSHFNLSMIYAHEGKLEAAVNAAEKADSLAPWNSVLTGYFAGMLKITGDAGRAARVLRKLGDGANYGSAAGFYAFHIACSEIDRAADWAVKAIEERDPAILAGVRIPLAEDLRSSSRWPALLKLMNFPIGN